nr:hypothetical protein GCM10020185_40680 [Pseudomonas brassicacearum subsp. brassicacearum]
MVSAVAAAMLLKPSSRLLPSLTAAARTLRLSRLPPRNIAAPHRAPALMKLRRLRPTIFFQVGGLVFF